MTCNEAIKHFHEFMDKELDKSHYLVVKKHIDTCDDCHKRYKYEMDVRALVKACCVKVTAPVYLHDRILEGLNFANAVVPVPADKEVIYQQKAPRTLFSSRYYAVAASVLISIAGGIFYYSNYYQQTDSITIVDDAVKNHVVAVNDNLVFNEKTSVVDNINKYLGNTINTRLRNTSPFLNAEQVNIKGGMPDRFYGTSSPCVIFDKGGNKLSLQVVRKGGFPITNLERAKLGHKEFYIGNRQGFNSVLWVEDGVTYCLTSDLNKSEMLKFAATLTSQ
ncbi:MAG: mycothiol system anti-sigma-R factor [Candidatus Brocadia sp. WS118]|nr:MAG: mycothiol system anti-sigma-R factor [Candidatus Brocadia sp. WS118]